jgi:hypothetical protein
MRQRNFISLLTISLVLLTTNLKAAETPADASVLKAAETPPTSGEATTRTGLGLGVVTTVGSQLDKQDNKASLTFEPTLSYSFGERRTIELYTAIDKPFNQYELVTVPKTILTYAHGFDWITGLKTTASAALNAISLDRWSTDGKMLRASVNLSGVLEITEGLTVALRVGPYGQLNEFKQSTAGRDLSKYGLTERVILEYTIGPVILDLVVLFDQKYTAVWKNAYSHLEQAAVRLDDEWTVGVSHEILGSAVDDSTGLFRPAQVFHERNSRVSAFVECQL